MVYSAQNDRKKLFLEQSVIDGKMVLKSRKKIDRRYLKKMRR